MATKKIKKAVMRFGDYRDPGSFVYQMGNKWKDFLARWNDPNITNDEARGLLHNVAERLRWADTAPQNIGEDSREACVRFLVYYASQPYKYDREWQIIEKARKVLIDKVLNARYIREQASDELVIDILVYLIKDVTKCIEEGSSFYDHEPQRRKIEAFLKIAYKTRPKLKIVKVARKLIL